MLTVNFLAILIRASVAAIVCFPSVVKSQDFNSPMSFREMTSGGNCNTCYWIAADGVIERDTATKLKEFLEYDGKTPLSGVRIHLNSPGGDLFGGIKLGEAIREMELNTAVSTSRTKEVWQSGIHLASDDPKSECSSACAFAFIGGVNRYAASNTPGSEVGFRDIGDIGVHQFYDRSSFIDPESLSRSGIDAIGDQLIVALLLRHIEDMGVSAKLLELAAMTLPNDMYYLTDDDLRLTSVDTWNVRDLFVRGYKNGVAITELQYTRKFADYRLELYCDDSKMMMLANVKWRGFYDVDAHIRWNFFDDLSIKSQGGMGDLKVGKISEEFFRTKDGDILGKFRFYFEGAPLKEMVTLKSFFFTDWSSRHANDAAQELSFRLPDNFDGLYLLPKACL